MNHSLIFSSCSEESQRGTGAHRIATILRDNGWDVEVIDFAAYWPLECLKELVKSRVTSSTIFFGFSVFFNHWNQTLEDLTSWLKSTYPNIKTVIGGQSVALTPASNMDYWVDSFGEVAILELVKSMIGNTSQGIKFDINFLGQKKLIRSISSYPAFPMKSYKTIMEKRDFLEPYEWLTTEFSRGCKFSCDFCNFPVLGVKGDYSRTQDDFEYEMRYNYDNFGIDQYYVSDETFNDSEEKIIKFADVADKLEFKPFFSGFVRADLIVAKPSTWEHYARLNFGGHYYGIESFNHDSAKLMKKGMNPDKIKEGLIQFKSYISNKIFYRGTISLIYGLPHETETSLNQSQEWLVKNWLDQSVVAFPLDIDRVNTKESNIYTNVSNLSLEKEKYGIREMSADDITYKEAYKFNWRTGNYSEKTLIWEHDTMNFYQARDLCFNFQDYLVHNFTMDNWQLHAPSINAGEKIPLSETAHMTKVSALINRQFFEANNLKKYIEKKLSWS